MLGKNSYPGGSAAGSAGRSVGCDALHLGVCGLDGKAGLLGVHGVAAGHGVGLRRGLLRQRTGGVLEKMNRVF